jgi:hypothetical protein
VRPSHKEIMISKNTSNAICTAIYDVLKRHTDDLRIEIDSVADKMRELEHNMSIGNYPMDMKHFPIACYRDLPKRAEPYIERAKPDFTNYPEDDLIEPLPRYYR